MTVTIEIYCDNDAFGDCVGEEVARILAEYARRVDGCSRLHSRGLYDENGNTVGSVSVTP